MSKFSVSRYPFLGLGDIPAILKADRGSDSCTTLVVELLSAN